MEHMVIDCRVPDTFDSLLSQLDNVWGRYEADESSSTSLTDSSGNGRNLAHSATNVIPQSAALDASSTFSKRHGATSPAITAGQRTTYSAFSCLKLYKTTAHGTGTWRIFGPSASTSFRITQNGTSGDMIISVRVGGTTTSATLSGASILADNTTYFVAMTWNGTTAKFYLDGVNVLSVTPSTGGAMDLESGGTDWLYGGSTIAFLDSGIITTDEITAAEITALQAARA
jgi:hypothetical protein